MGVTAGYTTGTQWVWGFDGMGRTDTFQVGLYGGFAQDKVYADALVGYAYSWNQMWRNISIPGLQPRTAQGRTGANQLYGQIETGYRFDLGTNANAFITPFARLQAYTGKQNAFTETGAQSLNLSVAQQTTNSLRSVIGAQIGGAMDLGWREKLLCSSAWAGAMSTPTRRGRCRRPWRARPRCRSRPSALRRSATAWWWASRPTPRSPRRRRSISATRATSPARTARMPSPQACV